MIFHMKNGMSDFSLSSSVMLVGESCPDVHLPAEGSKNTYVYFSLGTRGTIFTPSSLQIYQLERTGAMQLDRQLSQIKFEYSSGLDPSLLTNL